MILILLLIGAVLVVSAIRNSQGALFTALSTDAPGFVIWAAAIVAVGAVGFIPGLKPVSRGLLALILLVIFLKNYQTIIAGFQGADKSAATSSATNASGSTPAPSANTSTITPSSVADFASAFGSIASAI